MRPLELTIQGFGPFGGSERVDFSGITGVFLITGDTGAGKTTIFDAISFALFGQTSGSARQVDSVRSHYAPEQEPTRVRLRFAQHGKIFEIERSPRYERPRKFGKGMATEQPKATLTLADGTVFTGKETVNRRIEELLGFNYKQFKQVAMIAQGEFLQLLLAGSEKRGEIFRKVFHTESCQYLQAELKARLSLLRRQAEDAQMRVLAILQEFEVPGEDEVTESLAECLQKKDPYRARQLASGIEEWNRRDEAQRTELEKRLNEIESTLNSLQFIIRQTEKRDQLLILLRLQEEKTARQEEELARTERSLATAQEQRALIRSLDDELLRLQQMEQSCQRSESLRESLALLNRGEEELLRAEEEMQNARCEGEAQIERDRQRLLELAEIPERLSATVLRRQELRQERDKIHDAACLSRECLALEQELEACQNEYLKTEEEFQQAQAEHQRSEEIWLRAQAGILASGLRDGEPCPVCGSRVHPARADLCMEIPDETARKRAKQKAELLREKMQQKSRRAASVQSSLLTQRRHLEQTAADPEREESVRLQLEDAESEYKELQELLRERRAVQEKEKEREEEQNRIRKEAAELSQKLNQLRIERAGVQGAVQQEEERSGGVLLAELKERQDDIRARRQGLETALTEAEQSRHQLDQLLQQERGRLSALRQTLEQYNQELAGQPSPDELNERTAAVESERNCCREKQKEVDGRLRGNRMSLIRLKEACARCQKVTESCQALTALSQTANGELAGRPKLAFEQYIQAFYFEYVLKAANQRLNILSRGQYTLLRRIQAENLRSAEGLELEVLDHYTGRRRPVSSLSGGESFQAALSLALGLSDVIQSFAGGIEVDAVFIDEGFGSLDQSALVQALAALSKLSEGERMVGIISHVEMLKERIPRQIEVVKTIGGSHIRTKEAAGA